MFLLARLVVEVHMLYIDWKPYIYLCWFIEGKSNDRFCERIGPRILHYHIVTLETYFRVNSKPIYLIFLNKIFCDVGEEGMISYLPQAYVFYFYGAVEPGYKHNQAISNAKTCRKLRQIFVFDIF